MHSITNFKNLSQSSETSKLHRLNTSTTSKKNMTSHTTFATRATPRAAFPASSSKTGFNPLFFSLKQAGPCENSCQRFQLCASNYGGESYLEMWKSAVERQRKTDEFQRIVQNGEGNVESSDEDSKEELEKKSEEFRKILEVSREERDRVQRMQVIDRAAAAIAAAKAILEENGGQNPEESAEDDNQESGGSIPNDQGEKQSKFALVPWSAPAKRQTPGPDFWSWTPPDDTKRDSDNINDPQTARGNAENSVFPNPVKEKEQSLEFLSIPFESKLSENVPNAPLPPLQSLMELETAEVSETSPDKASLGEKHDLGSLFSEHAAEAAHALDKVDEKSSQGVNLDGSRWWRETGIEQRPDGVICRWTVNKGVSADQSVEWQEKYWEAADEFGYKELGSEKSGRDATGNIWREYWRESMRQENGVLHLEKTADKWGKNGKGDEWQEKWWEHYGGSGQAEKWAHKWCSIDPNQHLEAGHAHVWHERWGEKYDGHGGSIKYTDKWAERHEGGGWTKWGDKWDENFDPNSHGIKQGETWWQGKHGEQWNRTWGEHHNGSGWIHKYGKSTSGEHWDTHEQQDTWYERFPHYGFYHCYDNSIQLRQVKKPSEWS